MRSQVSLRRQLREALESTVTQQGNTLTSEAAKITHYGQLSIPSMDHTQHKVVDSLTTRTNADSDKLPSGKIVSLETTVAQSTGHTQHGSKRTESRVDADSDSIATIQSDITSPVLRSMEKNRESQCDLLSTKHGELRSGTTGYTTNTGNNLSTTVDGKATSRIKLVVFRSGCKGRRICASSLQSDVTCSQPQSMVRHLLRSLCTGSC